MKTPARHPVQTEAAALPSTLVICGKGSIATAGLSFAVHYIAAQRLGVRVAASPNTDDRGYDTWQPSLIRTATMLGVPVVALETVESDPDIVLVSLEYDRILRVERFASSRLYNLHFSALPRYRGVYTSIWPILNGETTVGVTLHYMDAGVDTGAVIAQRTAPLPPYLTARRLYDVFMDEGLALFREWLPGLLATIPAAKCQNGGDATSYNRRSLDLRRISVDLTQDRDEICRFVRAFSFPEYQLPTIDGRAVRSCVPIEGRTPAPPGTPLHVTAYSTSFAVGGGGIVEIIWG